MACPVCGNASSCVHLRQTSSALLDHEAVAVAPPGLSGSASAASDTVSKGLVPDWRREVVSRVQQHRARRRKIDSNTMELAFPPDAAHSFGSTAEEGPLPPPPRRFAEILVKAEAPKIIRFPRSMPAYTPAVNEVPLEELEVADPVFETPRILEVSDRPSDDAPTTANIQSHGSPTQAAFSELPADSAEQMELLSSFADIQLEPEKERIDFGLDLIPRPAPLRQRFISGLIDAAIVFIATGIFAFTFLELAEEMPQTRLVLVFATAAAGIFWLVFQYLFLTWKRATPGMHLTQLELCTFERNPAPEYARLIRALASGLSCFSAGLGYAWALVDEDRLGWHDRISQTHLKACSEILGPAREPYR